jgi:clan AA aspartic protease
MIIGRFVENERVVIPFIIFDGNGEEYEIEATIDTGFIGEVFLPYAMVQQLQLPKSSEQLVRLADGTRTRLPLYSGVIRWGEEEREVEVLASNRDYPLVGMELLRGGIAHFELFDGGDITIEEDE